MDKRHIAIHASLLNCNRRGAIAKALLSGGSISDVELETVDLESVERIQTQCEERRIKIICAADPDYPEALEQSPLPPAALFILGDTDCLNQSSTLAIVGARSADMGSSEIAADFANAAALSGMRVVSGLALGVDGAAHEGALRSGIPGSTIAVVANGLDITYPSSHTQLAARIYANGGAIISEYPPGVLPRTYHFLERNRIVAGLSFGVIVIQAGERSGALVTARLALEAGREVWVVPGSIRDPRFRGSNRLIQDGAHLISSPFEVPGIAAPKPSSTGSEDEKLSKNEKRVLRIVQEKGAAHLDELLRDSDLSMGMMRVALGELENKGIVQVMPGNFVRMTGT